MNAPTDLAALQPQHAALQPAQNTMSIASLMFDPARMQSLMTFAEVMASGACSIPTHLRRNKGDCLAVAIQALQWNMNPIAVAQKTHLVNGAMGYEGQLVNGAIQSMAPTRDRINYEWFGDWSKVIGKFEERESKKKIDEDTGKPLKYRVPAWGLKDEEGLGIRVGATMKGETEPRVLELLLSQCRVRNSPLWADDPRQQIAYLAVKRWARLHCPDVILGVYTPDELQEAQPPRDMGPAEVVEKTGTPGLTAEQLATWRTEAEKGMAAATAHWRAMGPELRKLATDDQKADMLRVATDADKRRTVDNPPPATPPAAATAKPAADAGTDDFAREIEAEEQRLKGAQVAGGAE